MSYRVIQWATGNLGRAAIEGIVSHPDLELVGVWVHSAEKAGKDAGELAERPDLMAFNARQLASYNAHASDLPFELLHGTACVISEVNRPGPPLTLISEFPDETIHGDPFILAHDTQTATVLAAVEALGLISFRP